MLADVLAAALQTSTEAVRLDDPQIRALTLGQRMSWYAAGELALAGAGPHAALHIAEELLKSSAKSILRCVHPQAHKSSRQGLIGT